MNAPYPPPPGQPYPPGPPYPPGQPYPPGFPPPRRGMGCFAKGCLVTVLVLFVLGLMAGAVGWVIYDGVRPYVGTAPVAVRKFPATAEQYEELQGRIDAFQARLASEHRASLDLSADDLNIYIARSPAYAQTRGEIYLGIADNQLVIDASFPVSRQKRRTGSTGTTYYFSGKLYCDFSYAGGDFTILVRKIEPLDGQATSAFVAAVVANPDFSRSLNRSFNDGFHTSLRRNPTGESFMAKVRSIVIQNNRLVITAADE